LVNIQKPFAGNAGVPPARSFAKPGCRLDQADGGFARRHSLKLPAPLCDRSCCRRDAGAPACDHLLVGSAQPLELCFDQKICGIRRDAGAPRLALLDSLVRLGSGSIGYGALKARHSMDLRKTLRRPCVRYAAIIAVAAILATVLWIVVRDPVRQLWSSSISNRFLPAARGGTKPASDLHGCRFQRRTAGVSDTFSASQFQDTGVMVFITYGGAVPQKNTFQIRWTIEGKVYKSTVGKFESETDFICLNLGKDLPAGNHSFEFLVDGEVRRNACMVIEGSSASNSPAMPPAANPGDPRRSGNHQIRI